MEEEKNVVVGKKRIFSTVVLTIFLVISCALAIPFIPFTWAEVARAVEQAEQGTEGAETVVAGFATALGAALVMVVVIIIYIITTVITGICLPFAIANRKSSLKPVRIISFVLDGAIGAILILSIVKLVMSFIGV